MVTVRAPLFAQLVANVDNGFYRQDIISVRQFDKDKLGYIFGLAQEMRHMVQQIGAADLLRGRVLANLFYEPSTRTSSSFMAAMQRLGGSVIPINEVHYSSVTKGESLPDTVRTLECYADIIVLRHPETGSAQIAADAASKPIINAGDGTGEHPTQALLDLFTILEELGGIDGIHVAMVGDLKYGRTVHSLTRLLSLFDVRLSFVSPESLRMPAEHLNEVRSKGKTAVEFEDVSEVIGEADVLYVTRVQRERFEDPDLYEKVKGSYVITPEVLQQAKERMVVMHPLPRVYEISREVDDDPRAAYFRQMENGMYIRMALLAAVLGRA
ncbi:MAG: aspartate carbamoyltransferase [Anaerolineae bacterium]